MESFWRQASKIDLSKCTPGRLRLLFSEDPEFVYGDGLFDFLFHRPLGFRKEGTDWISDLQGTALVPLLPNICAFIYFSHEIKNPKTDIVAVEKSIVTEINTLTQIYSKQEIFFRSIIPELTSEYISGEHMTCSKPRKGLIETIMKIP